MIPKAIRNENDINEAMKGLLMDGFSVYGDDASLFAKTQKRISDSTYSFTAPMRCVRVLSVLPEEEQPQDGRLAVYLLGAGGVSGVFAEINQCMGAGATQGKNAGALQAALRQMMVRTIPEKSFHPDGSADNQGVVQELKRTRLMFQVDKKAYIISQMALATLGQRIELKGKAIQEPSLERDIFIAKRLDAGKNIQFIVKSGNGLGKVFMVASENYALVPMTAIERIYQYFGAENKIGKMRCEGWEIDHSTSRIRFSFVDYEKARDMAFLYGLSEEETPLPGIEIISSDIGDCAFTVRGFWKVKGGYLYTDEVSRKHSGGINEEKIEREVEHTIFERYTALPERFMELLDTDITPESVREAAEALSAAQQAVMDAGAAGKPKAPESIALAQAERHAKRQFRDHVKLLTEVVRMAMKEISNTSVQYRKDWAERVTEALCPSTSYTAYDIMSIILDMQVMTKSEETAEKMRKSMVKLPYLDYGKYRDAVISRLALFQTRKAAGQDGGDATQDEVA